MILQIGQLFINTDNITTLNLYDRKVETSDGNVVEYGLIINGVRYALFTVKETDAANGEKTILGIVNAIISRMSTNQVVKISLE